MKSGVITNFFRWIAILPAALITLVIVLSTSNYFEHQDLMIGSFILMITKFPMAAYGFVVVGTGIAPKHKIIVAYFLAVIGVIIGLLLIAYGEHKEDVYLKYSIMFNSILFIVGVVYAVYRIQSGEEDFS